MGMGMVDNNQKVSLLLPISISTEKSEMILNSIILNYKNYFDIDLVQYKQKFKLFNELDRFLFLRNHINFTSDYIFTRSPLITIYCVLKKQKVIYEAHNSNFTKNKILNKIILFLFKKLINQDAFKLFVTISNNLNNFWITNGILQKKTLALHDCTSLVDKSNLLDVYIPFKNNKLLVTYTGSLYLDRGLDRIINLAKEFNNLNFLVVGGPDENAERFTERCKTDDIHNIHFTCIMVSTRYCFLISCLFYNSFKHISFKN